MSGSGAIGFLDVTLSLYLSEQVGSKIMSSDELAQRIFDVHDNSPLRRSIECELFSVQQLRRRPHCQWTGFMKTT